MFVGEGGRLVNVLVVFLKKEPDQDAREPLVIEGGLRRCWMCSVAATMEVPHRAQDTVSLFGLTPATVVGLEYSVDSEKRADTGMGSMVS